MPAHRGALRVSSPAWVRQCQSHSHYCPCFWVEFSVWRDNTCRGGGIQFVHKQPKNAKKNGVKSFASGKWVQIWRFYQLEEYFQQNRKGNGRKKNGGRHEKRRIIKRKKNVKHTNRTFWKFARSGINFFLFVSNFHFQGSVLHFPRGFEVSAVTAMPPSLCPKPCAAHPGRVPHRLHRRRRRRGTAAGLGDRHPGPAPHGVLRHPSQCVFANTTEGFSELCSKSMAPFPNGSEKWAKRKWKGVTCLKCGAYTNPWFTGWKLNVISNLSFSRSETTPCCCCLFLFTRYPPSPLGWKRNCLMLKAGDDVYLGRPHSIWKLLNEIKWSSH